MVPYPVLLISGHSLRFGDVDVFSCNPKFFAVRHIHYPVNPSSDHFPTDAVVTSSDHCCTETVLAPSDHYCIDTVAPSGDHYCIDIVGPSSDHCRTDTVPPSSDHYGTTKVAPPSDHLHTKRALQRKLFGEKTFTKICWGHGLPFGYAAFGRRRPLLLVRVHFCVDWDG